MKREDNEKMANLITTDTELTSIANAIRTQTGESNPLEYPADFISEIGELEKLPSATGVAF